MTPDPTLELHDGLSRLQDLVAALVQLGADNVQYSLSGADVAVLLDPVAERIDALLERAKDLTPERRQATL